jgi:GTP-binding protein
MEIKSAEFVISNTKVDLCPKGNLPEYAFIGRSNVGKSSLINMLTKKPKLAMTSATPGKTLLINHFLVNKEWYLVDLPGYGYHKAGKEHTDVWDTTMNDYFTDNQNLKAVLLLLDSRIKPTELDKQMLDYLAEHEIPAVIIMTKTDKISRSEVFQNMSKISKEIRFNKDLIIATSALKKQGVERIETLLDEYLKN